MPKFDNIDSTVETTKGSSNTKSPMILRPFRFHGVDVNDGSMGQAKGTCPFCQSSKFSISVKEDNAGQWDCKSCGAKGNVMGFIRALWESSYRTTTSDDFNQLAEERSFLSGRTCEQWGLCKSSITGEWIVPGYSPGRKLCQLYRYVKNVSSGKYRLMATPQEAETNQMIRLQMCMPFIKDSLFQSDSSRERGQLPKLKILEKCDRVYVGEGLWDTMAHWEIAENTEYGENAGIVAVPSANVFFDSWIPMFTKKKVILMYDSDHPKVHLVTKKKMDPIGYAGVKRVAEKLMSSETPPLEVNFIKWGQDGYDPELPSGTDVRDYLSGKLQDKKFTYDERVTALSKLMDKVSPLNIGEITSGDAKVSRNGKHRRKEVVHLPVECSSWTELLMQWRRAVTMSDGLEKGLAVVLASVASTEVPDSQLWIKLMGPASSLKTTICEAIALSKKNVFSVSIFTGFHSGFRPNEKGGDNSLINKLYDKTLVIKEGDTLLQAANRDILLSEMRDLYDRTSRAHFKTGIHYEKEGINVTVILAGTDSLRQLDASELGARYLDCMIMETIDDDYEDDVGWRVGQRVLRNIKKRPSTNGNQAGEDEDVILAKRMTAGYVEHLRDNIHDLLDELEMSDDNVRMCMAYGKFVSFMRARPSKKQEEKTSREFSPRLVEQFTKLATCLTIVMGKKKVDDEVMRRVRQITMDTSYGWVLDMTRHLYRKGDEGVETETLRALVNSDEDKIMKKLRFLKQIGVVEYIHVETKVARINVISKPRWRLTERLRRLYSTVVGK